MKGTFLLEVSKRIKIHRLNKRLTVQELAEGAGVTKGLISQIENGRSIPSLPVLFGIIQALGIAMSDFFKDLNLQEPNILVQRKEDYEAFSKEDAQGFSYERIFVKNLPASTVDFVLLHLEPGAQREEVSTEAFEYKYILDGKVDYHINGAVYSLKAGDSLFFDGRLSHVPRNTGRKTCTMLIVYFFDQK